MQAIVNQGQNWVLTIPKALISDKEIQRIIELIRFYEGVKESEMTEQSALLLSDELKSDWWEANEARILSKIKGE